eukprot:4432970-Pyramimonas_sp.AAC.2
MLKCDHTLATYSKHAATHHHEDEVIEQSQKLTKAHYTKDAVSGRLRLLFEPPQELLTPFTELLLLLYELYNQPRGGARPQFPISRRPQLISSRSLHRTWEDKHQISIKGGNLMLPGQNQFLDARV